MIRVEYGVVAKGAKEGFVPELLNCSLVSNADDLSKEDLSFKNFSNPCEEYSVLLDGGSLPIPENTEDENMGVWSLYATDENGNFEEAFPTVSFVSDDLFDVDGIGLEFDSVNNIYPTSFEISWYNGENLIVSKDYESNSTYFSFMEDVENFNKIVIVFKKMNTPYSRLKLHGIQYGSILMIDEKMIKSMRLHQSVNAISTTIPISSLGLNFINSTNANYNFSARQSLKIFDNETLVGKYFIDSAKQENKQQWNIKAQDYIGVLESTEFEGGIYVDELASNILTDVFNAAKVPFFIHDSFSDSRVTGFIPYTTCRKAVQQILFAIGGYASTAYSENVDIMPIDMDIDERISLDRVLTCQSVEVTADVTEIELVAHTYSPTSEEIVLYKASAEENSIKIIFNEPVHDLTIENGKIEESGTNYAIIKCAENGILKGQRFDHLTFAKSMTSQNANQSKSTNKKLIRNATLISPSNIDNVLNICYNYLTRNVTVKSKVIESDLPLVVGHSYEIETELLGYVHGSLSEQNFSLFGGKKIVKETVIK